MVWQVGPTSQRKIGHNEGYIFAKFVGIKANFNLFPSFSNLQKFRKSLHFGMHKIATIDTFT